MVGTDHELDLVAYLQRIGYTGSRTVLNTYPLQGRREQRMLTSVEELRAALQEIFRLALPEAPELDLALQRVLTTR